MSASSPPSSDLGLAFLAPFDGVKTFLVNMPLPTTFSTQSEVQAILASFPFLLLGPLGIGLSLLQLTFAPFRLSSSLDIYLAIGLSFLSSLLDLFNVLLSEAARSPKEGTALGIASAVALSLGIAFKFAYLFRRTRMPMRREREDWAERGGAGKKASWKEGLRPASAIGGKRRQTDKLELHSGS